MLQKCDLPLKMNIFITQLRLSKKLRTKALAQNIF